MAGDAATVRAVSGAAVLSRRALNRALLSRQLLLGRPELPSAPDGRRAAVIGAVEQLIGLQAQAPFPPYYGLWSRLGRGRGRGAGAGGGARAGRRGADDVQPARPRPGRALAGSPARRTGAGGTGPRAARA